MRNKLYFATPDSEICYPAKDLIEEGFTEAYEAIPEQIQGFAWCRAAYAVINESDSPCGRDCPEYAPKNGRSGMCRWKSNKLYELGELVKLK